MNYICDEKSPEYGTNNLHMQCMYILDFNKTIISGHLCALPFWLFWSGLDNNWVIRDCLWSVEDIPGPTHHLRYQPHHCCLVQSFPLTQSYWMNNCLPEPCTDLSVEDNHPVAPDMLAGMFWCLSVCPSAYVYMYVCLCLSVCVCISVCLCIYVCLLVSVCLSACVNMYICLSACICMSVCLYLYICLFLSVCLSAYVYMSVCLCLYVCLPMYICLYVCQGRTTGIIRL